MKAMHRTSPVGQSHQRIDAIGKVTGKTLFPGDYSFPDQLYGKLKFAEVPHGIIKHIDTSTAEALEGVVAVFTARDVPNNEYGLIMPDQPVLSGPGSNKPFADRVRFIGDQVALVVAETPLIATEAIKRIDIIYEPLPILVNVHQAMKNDAFLIHPDKASNILCQYRIRKGDVDEAFRQADVIIESDYTTPVQEHAYLQPEAGVGYIDEQGHVTIVVAGQWTHEDQEQIAHALDLPKEKVRVIYPAIGGAFGGREDMSIQIVLALAAWKLDQRGIRRPVKIIWSREESIIGHHKRHPYFIHAKWGANKEGKILAAELQVIADAGAYAYTSTKVLANATLMCTGPYDIPNVRVDSCAVYTNHLPNGAFRGFGGPQAAFAAEIQMNKLAEKLGLDPVEMRMRNLLDEGALLSVGTPLPKGVSIRQVVKKCALAGGWNETNGTWQRVSDQNKPGRIKRGIGIACAFKNVGFSFGAPEECWATIELYGKVEIEKVVLRHAGADVGQGAHTVFCQMAAQALNVPVEKVHLIASDTAETHNSGSASASRMTFMAGNAILGAAQGALAKWENEERPAIETYLYHPPRTSPIDPHTGKSEPNFAYGYVAEVVDAEVDTVTGHIHVHHVICADDVGNAINPQQVEGQVEGAIIQALGYTLMENFIQRDGEVLTRRLSTYLIPTALDLPDKVTSVLLEYPDPIGPYGARGMGEMPYLPFAPAVVSAVHDATGVWFHEFPLLPERVLRGLGNIQ